MQGQLSREWNRMSLQSEGDGTCLFQKNSDQSLAQQGDLQQALEKSTESTFASRWWISIASESISPINLCQLAGSVRSTTEPLLK